MAVLDTEVLNEQQYHLLETADNGATVSSGLWTVAEMIDALNETQYRFLKDTLLLVTPAVLVTIPNQLRHALPADWIATYDATYHTAADTWHSLAKADGFEADNSSINDWPVELGTPILYTEGEVPTLTMQIMPASLDAGVINILYVALSTTLSNSGVALTVPDEFAPAIKWGALEQLLSKVGRGQDAARAAYCRLRYSEGVAAAALMLDGWA